jgi:hypothetical protein
MMFRSSSLSRTFGGDILKDNFADHGAERRAIIEKAKQLGTHILISDVLSKLRAVRAAGMTTFLSPLLPHKNIEPSPIWRGKILTYI